MAEMRARQCLLVFDDAEDATLRSGGSSTTEPADLAEYLPKSRLCSAIFTTTNSDTAQALAQQNVIALQELTQGTALRMLQSLLVTLLSKTEQQEAEHMLKELLYLPLAVAQAAACMNASGMTVQEYRSQLDEHKELALKHSGNTSAGKLLGYGIRDPVASTLFLSMGQVSRGNVFAVDCLFLAACVDRKDIPLEILETASLQTRQDAIKVLNKYALITRRPAESALDVHRLVHHALRRQLQVQEGLQQWTQRTITQLLRVFPDDEHSNRSKWRRFIPHVQYALSQSLVDHDDKSRLQLAGKCAMALYSDGRYNEAEELFVQVMETRKRVLGDEHPDTLTSMHNLAHTLQSQARYDKALVLIERCFQLRRQLLGEQHPDTQSSLNALNSWRAN
jgi:tetratricopeptide (TPR) repeat protein